MDKEKYNQIIDEVYGKYADSHWTPPPNPNGKLLSDQLFSLVPMEHSKESFINKIKTDSKFSKKWGLKIEERELSLEERNKWSWDNWGITCEMESVLDGQEVPTKQITLEYNNEKTYYYE